MNKYGWTKGFRSILSFIFGILFLFIGSYQLFFKNIQALAFLSQIFNKDIFIYICLVIAGILLFIDSFSISHGGGKALSILAGLIILLIGIFPILTLKLNILQVAMPFTSLSVFQGVLAFFGLYLIIDAFVMKAHSEIHN